MSTQVRITLNDDRHRLSPGPHPVAEIKGLATPPISTDDVLWIDAEGVDVEVPNDGVVEVSEGLVLYSAGPDGAHPRPVKIVIDGTSVVSGNKSVTEEVLRRLVDPPVPADRDLYRDIDGAPDEKIDPGEVVTLRKGAEFYSVPRLIAPGRS